jgi:hypothetical protein
MKSYQRFHSSHSCHSPAAGHAPLSTLPNANVSWKTFIVKVSVLDRSFNGMLTKKYESKNWETGKTQWHFDIFPRHALYEFQWQMLFKANLVRNLGEGLDHTCESKIICIDKDKGVLAVQIGRVAEYNRSISQDLQENKLA